MQPIKKCPSCNSEKITGGIFIEDGFYMQRIHCKKCGYKNKRIIGSAVRG